MPKICLRLVVQIIVQIFRDQFCDDNFGFRSYCSVHDVLRRGYFFVRS